MVDDILDIDIYNVFDVYYHIKIDETVIDGYQKPYFKFKSLDFKKIDRDIYESKKLCTVQDCSQSLN